MPGESILVTGSSGLVGYPLSRQLIKHGDRVIGLDPAPPPEPVEGMTHIREGFGGYASMRALLEQYDIGRIVHAGGDIGPDAGRRCAVHHRDG